MCKEFLKKKMLLCVGILYVSFSALPQNPNTPYNVVMNLYKDPTTQMTFNWFTGVGVTGGEVQIMLNGNTITVPATCTQHSS